MNKKSMVLFSIAMSLIVLSAAGVAYAHWEKVITFDGIIQTGSVSWEWRDPFPEEAGDLGVDYWAVWDYPIFYKTQGNKDVASAAWTHTVSDPLKFIELTITNGYPFYMLEPEVHVYYTGKTPGWVQGVDVYNCSTNPPTLLGTITSMNPWNVTATRYDDAGAHYVFDLICIQPYDDWTYQIHWSQLPYEWSFGIILLEDIKQDHSYCLGFVWNVINYNEKDGNCGLVLDPRQID